MRPRSASPPTAPTRSSPRPSSSRRPARVLGAIFKRGEGRRATRHVLDELGDVGIVLVVLAAREGYGLNELITRRFEEVRRR
jgi:hypothetical protein